MEIKDLTREDIKALYAAIEILSETYVPDNDGWLFGYFKRETEELEADHQAALKVKNDLIKEEKLTEAGYQVIVFNFGEGLSEFKGDEKFEEFIELCKRYHDIPSSDHIEEWNIKNGCA
jgi:hypothetical protein